MGESILRKGGKVRQFEYSHQSPSFLEKKKGDFPEGHGGPRSSIKGKKENERWKGEKRSAVREATSSPINKRGKPSSISARRGKKGEKISKPTTEKIPALVPCPDVPREKEGENTGHQ